MNKFKRTLIFGILLFFSISLLGGSKLSWCSSTPKGREHAVYIDKYPNLRFLFYNVENLFDCEKDRKNDFRTPQGKYFWSKSRYYRKIEHISKAIISCGDKSGPDFIGLAEIENRKVLSDLCKYSSLRNLNYEIVHFEDDDPRGIECGILYKPDRLQLIASAILPLSNSDSIPISRGVLFAQFQTRDTATFYCLVNHWPSRYSGHLRTEPKRLMAAACLKQIVDSLYKIKSDAYILVMGDFNDEEYSNSMELLSRKSADANSCRLVNYLRDYPRNFEGTIKFKGKWFYFDQILTSSNLLKKGDYFISPKQVQIGAFDFLLQKEKRKLGSKPFRTYNGPAYIGGYSDHLPVFIHVCRTKSH